MAKRYWVKQPEIPPDLPTGLMIVMVWTCVIIILLLLFGLAKAEVYRFGTVKDSQETYSDGTTVPHRIQSIERQLADGTWQNLGYIEIHIHNVNRDNTDIEDVSAGVTVRVNPKVK